LFLSPMARKSSTIGAPDFNTSCFSGPGLAQDIG
jgi:hypothetical protein